MKILKTSNIPGIQWQQVSTLLLLLLANCFSYALGQNIPPVAEAGPAEKVVMSPLVTPGGSAGVAGDNAIDTYEWRNAANEITGETATFEAGPPATERHVFP